MGTVFSFPYRTVAEISIRALLRNLYTLRNYSGLEIIPVVKADAYGHGMVPIAKALVTRGSCLMLAVATLEEAIELRKQLPLSASILVLSGFLPHQLDAYLRYRLVPVIHCMYHLKSLLGKRSLPDLHLKIDSGMRRLGVTEDEFPDAIVTLKKLGVKLSGVASHFSESENTLSPRTDKQIAVFESMLAELRRLSLVNTDAKIHIANSGGALRRKLGPSTAIRSGLALYGISPNPRLHEAANLISVLEWKTRVLCIKDIGKGDRVGYGGTYVCHKKERLAIIPVGYADGFTRLLSNTGHVLIAGKKCPVRGRVSMDLTAVDCSHVPSVKEASLVTLIGRQGQEVVSAWDIANWTKTIPYEVLCGISPRVGRLYTQ